MRIEEEAVDLNRFADPRKETKKKSPSSVEQAILSSLVTQAEETKALGKNFRDFKKGWKIEEVTEGKEA